MIKRLKLCAQNAKFTDVRFPAYVSFKYDGLRFTCSGDEVLSKDLKVLPNVALQEMLGHEYFKGLDGEIMWGDPTSETVCLDTGSVIRSEKKPLDGVKFYVFDDWTAPGTFEQRQAALKARLPKSDWFIYVEQVLVNNLQELEAFYRKALSLGYEGVVTNSPDGPYKEGRSTIIENFSLKFKPRETSEARVVGWYEGKTNKNKAVVNSQGLTKRGHSQANMVNKGVLGGFDVVDLFTEVDFKVGGGKAFTEAFRQEMWDLIQTNPDAVMGRVLRYSFIPIGVKTRPRQPQMDCWRDAFDMTKE
jgi:hypothetical protein